MKRLIYFVINLLQVFLFFCFLCYNISCIKEVTMGTITQNIMLIDEKIYKMSKMYNYFENKKAIKILSNLTQEEASIVLSDSRVQDTISKIDDVNTLREVFRKSPAFFQEVMFSNEKTQDLLISPRKSLSRKELIKNYNNWC